MHMKNTVMITATVAAFAIFPAQAGETATDNRYFVMSQGITY